MGTLYLVRHGQASWGDKNYDQLSALGLQQSIRLGEYFARSKLQFDYVFTGTLQRHLQTWQGIAQALYANNPHVVATQPLVSHHPGLNEYDSDALIQALPASALESKTGKEHAPLIQTYFRHLRQGLALWMDGKTQPSGMPSYDVFAQGVLGVLEQAQQSKAEKVLVVSSGGPLSAAIGHWLGAMHPTRIDLNMQLRNSSVSEIHYSPSRCILSTFNTLPHLDPAEHSAWITYA
jgi:broad specificity phosphatase PhoE